MLTYTGATATYAVTAMPRRGNYGRATRAVRIDACLTGERSMPLGVTVTVPAASVREV